MVASGDPVYASDINSLIPVVAIKTSSTTRNNTATYADDPELTAIPLAIGTYDIEFVGFHTQASTTPKIKTTWGFTGTWNGPTRACMGPGTAQVGGPGAVTDMASAGNTTANDSVYSTSTSGQYSVIREVTRNVKVTVAGNLSLKWAQSVATVADTILRAESHFVIRKIS